MAKAGSEADDELAPMEDVRAAAPPARRYADQLADRLSQLNQLKAQAAGDAPKPELVLTLPHSTAVHAIALPVGTSCLYSGGADGFIRRYALFDSLNGVESPRNCMNKQGNSTPPVLAGYWENGVGAEAAESGAKWGPRSISSGIAGKAGGSPVHSMVVQSQELFGISGTQTGEMNLWTIRHDEGQIRHVFRSSTDAKTGHAPTAAVSALCFAADEKSLYSGGWDARLLHWDLNTGSVVRSFTDRGQGFASEGMRANQISSIALHPLAPAPALPAFHAQSKEEAAVPNSAVDAPGSPEAAFDPLFDDGGEAAADADDSIAPIPDFNDTGLPALSEDLLLASSISGQILFYDRRAEGQAIRRLPLAQGTAPFAMSACFSESGDQIFVGRRDAAVDVYDIKAGQSRVLKLPPQSAAVSALAPLPGGKHLLIASNDSLRVWNLQHHGKGLPYATVPGYYGTTVSQLACDPTTRLMASAVGSRGWSETRTLPDTEGVCIYKI